MGMRGNDRISTFHVLMLSVTVMAFGIGVFYVTLSGDLSDPVAKRTARRKG